MEIIITYSKIETEDYTALGGDVERTEKTFVEVYTLPVVAVARMDALRNAGIECTVKSNIAPIVEVR
jgi:hypothetical protein